MVDTVNLIYLFVGIMYVLSSSLEAPKDETPAKEKELPPKNMEKRVIEARSVLVIVLVACKFGYVCMYVWTYTQTP